MAQRGSHERSVRGLTRERTREEGLVGQKLRCTAGCGHESGQPRRRQSMRAERTFAMLAMQCSQAPRGDAPPIPTLSGVRSVSQPRHQLVVHPSGVVHLPGARLRRRGEGEAWHGGDHDVEGLRRGRVRGREERNEVQELVERAGLR